MAVGSHPAIGYGTITQLMPGMQTMSIPPQCRCSLVVKPLKMIRGNACDEVMFFYIGDRCPVEKGKTYLFGGTESDGVLVFKAAEPVASEDEARKLAEKLLAVPYGWDSATKSPFTKKWAGPTTGATSVCATSGRPAYAVPAGLEMTVDQIIPPDASDYGNPYGNGEFKITITNKTSAGVMVPVVKVGSKYDFEQSLVITIADMDEGTSTRCIFPEDVPAGAEMTLIPAGGSISGTVNTLKLKGVNWPSGGNRVYFNFGIGGLVAQNFFYYYSSIHDAMRPK
ncbi:Hypothetical protein GSB_11354 [Giardia duodenalis]|uniref:Uncharacterized protein n=2 Tax=Giardia intestinalis TaxID=5741 RepID=C6M0B1_GIAIB|nr:Hypothetical protein GL50581_4499 [Giardia intestinalis ATCC 50581]ESU44680.1 Hypothetical protein GSB_11354 [Giardia intestinalis]